MTIPLLPCRIPRHISRTRSRFQKPFYTFLKRGTLVIMTNKRRRNVKPLEGCGGIETSGLNIDIPSETGSLKSTFPTDTMSNVSPQKDLTSLVLCGLITEVKWCSKKSHSPPSSVTRTINRISGQVPSCEEGGFIHTTTGFNHYS